MARSTATHQLNPGAAEVLDKTTNDGMPLVAFQEPYSISFTIEGVAPLIFNRWSIEGNEARAKAPKGSAAKKTDDLETMVYRDDEGRIGLPGVYVHNSIIEAARYRQDPRSSRKSAMSLYKAAISPLTELSTLGTAKWDYVDRRRMTVQRAGITRHRPAFNVGWQAAFVFQVNLPEYLAGQDVLDVLSLAGRVVGVGDSRPTYGRFQVTNFAVSDV